MTENKDIGVTWSFIASQFVTLNRTYKTNTFTEKCKSVNVSKCKYFLNDAGVLFRCSLVLKSKKHLRRRGFTIHLRPCSSPRRLQHSPNAGHRAAPGPFHSVSPGTTLAVVYLNGPSGFFPPPPALW